MKRFAIVTALLLFGCVAAFAQTDDHDVVIDVIDIAVIALNDNTTDVTFTTTAPALPGDDPGPVPATPATNTDKRLWYTVCAATTKKITVTTDAAVPAGTQLTVQAAPEAGAGTGSTVNISAVATTDLVTAIPSVATGRTGTDGTALTYSFWVSAPASLVVGASSTINVLYTITDT